METPSPFHALFELGRDQHGAVAVRQALELGFSRSTLGGRVRREGWARPHPGVVLLPGWVEHAEVAARAAALAIGAHAVVTGDAALHLHGVLDRPPPKVDLVVPAARRARTLPGVRVTRSRTLCEDDRVADHGVLVATPQRAFLDVARRAGQPALRSRLIDARQRHVVAVEVVAARAAAVGPVPGRGRLLAACAEVDGSGADSALVAEVERRLRLVGIPVDVPPRTVATPDRTLHPDVTVTGHRVALEIDGFGTHSSRQALDLDQRKHNAYALGRWTVLRISWTRLADDWDGFLAEVRDAMTQA